MIVIRCIADIELLKVKGTISDNFTQHLLTHFKGNRGSQKIIGILDREDLDLAVLGLPEALEEVMPEWASRLIIPGELYGAFYFLGQAGNVVVVYVASHLWSEVFQKWLLAQPDEGWAENEKGSSETS
jgi:hypothetical protein